MQYPNTPQQNLEFSCTNLAKLYYDEKKSVSYIAKLFKCSQNKVNYYLDKCEIPKRTISEAIYHLKNPNGDPFIVRDLSEIQKNREAILYGLGIGLYWGEGQKNGKSGVRLTNTDPKLLNKFIEFLKVFFGINRDQLRFGLQIFNDLSPEICLQYWTKMLGVNSKQFYKVVVSMVRGPGTYKNKSKNGVIIVYFNNVKLKKIICNMIENIS